MTLVSFLLYSIMVLFTSGTISRHPSAIHSTRMKRRHRNCRQGMVSGQRRIARPHNRQALHARLLGCLDLAHVIAQKQPAQGIFDFGMRSQNLLVAGRLHLEASIDSVEPVRHKGRHVRGGGRGVPEEELLGGHGTRRVDDDLFASGVSGPDKRSDVVKNWRLEDAGLVAVAPEVALQRLEVRRLDVALDEVSDVRLEGRAVVAVLFWKGITIRGQDWRVPLLV